MRSLLKAIRMEYPAALRKKAGRDRFLLICFLYDMVCLHFLPRGAAAARSGRLPYYPGRKRMALGRRAAFCRSASSYIRDSSSLRFAHSSRSSLGVAYTGSYSSVTPPDAPQPVDISSVSLCRYEHCVLFPSQLALEHISLRRCSALFSLLRKHAPSSRPRRRSRICPRMTVNMSS